MTLVCGATIGLMMLVLGEWLRSRAPNLGRFIIGDTLVKLAIALVVLSCALEAALAIGRGGA